MSDRVIETTGVQKSYKGQRALDGLDLRVPAGSIFGFLGRNGAGKTTTIRLLLGFARADSGEVRVFGQPVTGPACGAEIRRRIGFVSEDKDLYPYMTVRQILQFTRPFFSTWRDDLEQRYLGVFDLPPARKISQLSKGMRAKLMLLLAISHSPELLVLDEPTEGLDPVATEEVLRTLVGLAAAEGTTVFFSSHQLTEVEQIADQVAIIDRGRTVLSGALEELKLEYQRLHVVFPQEPVPVHWLDGAERVRQEGRTVSILARRNVEALVEQARSVPGVLVERYPVSLKDLFLEHVRSN